MPISTPPSKPGLKLLLPPVVVATAVASVDFVGIIDATYREYELHWQKVAGGSPLWLRGSSDGGATFLVGSSYSYAGETVHNNGGVSNPMSTGTASIILSGFNNGPPNSIASYGGTSGKIVLSGLADASIYSHANVESTSMTGATAIENYAGSACIQSAVAINALRVLLASGNIPVGSIFSLYGVASS